MHFKLKHPPIFTLSLLFFVFIVVSLVSLELFYRTKYTNVISPNVYFWGQNVSGYSYEEFSKLVNAPFYNTVNVLINSTPHPIALADIGFKIDIEQNWKILAAQKKECLEKPFYLSFIGAKKPLAVKPIVSYDKALLFNEIDKISSLAITEVVFEEVVLDADKLKITKGKDGSVIDKDAFEKTFLNSVYDKKKNFAIQPNPVNSRLSETEKKHLLDTASLLVGKSIKIFLEEQELEISDKELISTLNDSEKNNNKYINQIVENISKEFDRQPKDSVFVFENGKVTEFAPSLSGVTTNIILLKDKIISTRDALAKSDGKQIVIELPHTKSAPKITTENINNFGIKEKISSGVSYFKGSIVSRIHNIRLASSKFNGVLIAPDEILSFNKTLGDVSKVTGYQPAYIIRDGQTILGDGGGVCQVSTTLFRAALNAGLSIIERRGHSYRVSYYEQSSPPGIDVTVFDPSTDLKIQNNTDNYILIQTVFDDKAKSLVFDLYGTKDERTISLSKPVVKEQVAPPEDLYMDDPALPSGTIKQIDYKAWGAKVYFNYKVEKGGETIIDKIFYTNYQPWQAKFLRGTAL